MKELVGWVIGGILAFALVFLSQVIAGERGPLVVVITIVVIAAARVAERLFWSVYNARHKEHT